MTETGFIAATLAVATFAVAAMELSPRNPRHCEPIVLTVQRAFTEDCQWQVVPLVRGDGERIDVELQLRGSALCDQAMTDRTFEIRIGSLPAGRYVLGVHWSDSDSAESFTFIVGKAEGDE